LAASERMRRAPIALGVMVARRFLQRIVAAGRM
jgi:hypothetical protein